MKHAWMKKLSFSLLFTVSLCSVNAAAAQANTLFDVPSFGLEVDNSLYENTSGMIQATNWGHGTEANIINTIGIETSITELNEQVSPSGSKSVVSIYTNGATIPGAAVDALANAGWKRMAWYYYDYMVEGNPETGLGDLSPVCGFVEDETVRLALEQKGYDGKYETISVSGWNVQDAYVTLYTKETIVSPNKHFDVYKYEPETNSFIPLKKQGFYGDNYFSLFYTLGDGIYIATNTALTEEQMASAETVSPEIPPVDTQAEENSNVPDTTDTETSVQSDNEQESAEISDTESSDTKPTATEQPAQSADEQESAEENAAPVEIFLYGAAGAAAVTGAAFGIRAFRKK